MDSRDVTGIAYIPVLHKGYCNYLDLLAKEGVGILYLVSDYILEKHASLDYINRKDRIRALGTDEMRKALGVLTSMEVRLLGEEEVKIIQEARPRIITPNEDIGRVIVDAYFNDHEVTYSSVFLRRNELNAKADMLPEGVETIAANEFQKTILGQVFGEAEKSADWWRHVGAGLIKEGEIIALGHNEHMPEKQLPNIIGDLRALYKKGVYINHVTSAHAEAAVIADAAKRGVSTAGADLYITDYPCPYCARLIAKSGIKKLYFVNGYALLEEDDIFEAEGIEVIHIQA